MTRTKDPDDADPSVASPERSILVRHPPLRAVLGAECLSATGDAVFWVGLLVWLIGRPGATGLIALAAFARLAPRVLFGAAGGVLADHRDRRVLLVGLDLTRAALMLALAFLVDADGGAGMVLAFVFVSYVLATPYRPAIAAGVPFVVGERDAAAANALDGAVRQVATFLGPLLGTAVILLGRPSWAFVLNAVTFALSAMLLARVSRLGGVPVTTGSRVHGRVAASWWRSLRDGVSAVTGQSGLSLAMWLVFVFSVARGFELVLLVLVAEDRLGMSPEGVGVLSAAIGVGALSTVPLVRRIATVRRPDMVVVSSLLLTAVPLALLSIIDDVLVACVVLIAVGVGLVVFEVIAVTIVQRLTPLELLGRVFGIENMAVNGGKLAGSLLGPLLVAVFSLEAALVVAAFVVTVSAIVAVPGLRRVAQASVARRKTLEPVLRVLANLALFDGASEPALERLARMAQPRVLKAGDRAVTEGEPPDYLYVIRTGTFRVMKQGVTAAELGRDDWFGEIGFLNKTPRTATVIAVTDADVWRIPGAEFLAAVNESALPPTALLEGITARLGQLDNVAEATNGTTEDEK